MVFVHLINNRAILEGYESKINVGWMAGIKELWSMAAGHEQCPPGLNTGATSI